LKYDYWASIRLGFKENSATAEPLGESRAVVALILKT